MKCIKAIKESKYYKIGEIVRAKDTEAHEKVLSGYWMYIPKSEWKAETRKPVEVEVTEEKSTKTIAEKQLNRKKRTK